MNFLMKVFNINSIKTLFSIASKISSKTHKSIIKIIIDMIKCGVKYQASFHDYLEFEFYELNNNERKTYLTRGKNNEIIRKFNDINYFHILDDKIEFNNYFKEYIKRDTIDLRKATLKEFKEFVYDKDSIIVKPIIGEGGKGIRIVDLKDTVDDELFDELIYNNEYLIEEIVEQHSSLNTLYDKSVNTMRMFTFCNGSKVYFLDAILKIGNGGCTDNFSSGGMYAFLDETGKVITPAIDRQDNIFKEHPITNVKIYGFQVPYFKESIDMVKSAALKIPNIGYIGWDVAVTNSGPLLIEGNSYPGIFQIKPTFGCREGLIPKYEDIMGIKLTK